MRPYETLLILKTVGTEAELAQSVTKAEEAIKRIGGRIEHSQGLGRRRLAYRIARQSEGFYQVVRFTAPPEQIDELKRLYRLNESIVRFLILQRDHPLVAATTSSPEQQAVGA